MEKEFDVFGIGNLLMDILIQVDDNHLLELNLKKGIMHLVEEDEAKKHFETIKEKNPKMAPAGACANTIMALASMGGKGVLCGKLGMDDHGDIYEEIITKDTIKSNLVRSDQIKTGQVISFVTPDGERTMSTHLGAAIHLQEAEVFDEDIRKSKILYLTGYLLEAPNLRESALKAIRIARRTGTIVAIDLADPELIRRNLDDLKKIVKEHADILFLNENEAKMFTGKENEEAATALGEYCDIGIVKIGKEGQWINDKGRTVKNITEPVKAIDTTGAGDVFAGGFLYGLAKEKTVEECAEIGSHAAAKIVQQMGARFENSIKEDIENLQ